MDKNNRNDEKNRRRRPVEREGVIYTPSSYDETDLEETKVISSREVRRNIPASTPNTKKVPSRRRGSGDRNKKTGYALFLITTIFIGVLVCVFVFAAFYKSIIDDKGNGTGNTITATPSVTPTDGPLTTGNDDGQTVSGIGIILGVDSGKKSVGFLDSTTESSSTLFVDGATELRDKYGNSMVFNEFEIGDIVDVQFKKSGNILLYLKISPQYWEHSEVTKVKVSPDTKSITYNNEKYGYGDNLIVKYKSENFDITKLSDIDLVTIRGYSDKVLLVDVIKRHGAIILEENTDIINGTVEIDGGDFIALEPREVSVLEGRHQIIVRGSNIEPFTTEKTVEAGETYKLDLSEVVFNKGVMSFKINESDVKLTVNGEDRNPSEPLVLDYGEYEIVAEKEGFNKFEKTVTFDTAKLEVEIELERLLKISAITISTTPEGANVYIDDQYVGISPVTVSVTYGSHVITVRKDGYITVDIPIDVSIDSLYRNIILQSIYSGY